MFHTLSKLFTLFLMPFTWLFVFFTIAYFGKSAKRQKTNLLVALLILFVFGNSYFASKIMRWWEPKALPISAITHHDIGIVLGGGIANEFKKPFDRVHFGPSADRLLQAIQLYKKRQIKKILISAGSASIFKTNYTRTEAHVSKDFLIEIGIPIEDIILEADSKNTFENALFTSNKLKELGFYKSNNLLITSAYHMQRSIACFQKQGLKVQAFPCNFSQTNNSLLSFYTLIPDEEAFAIWYDLCHEWFGLISYKLMGYI
jgi:uncharacterized SAM-binding protein YcdF (DUF218 family)